MKRILSLILLIIVGAAAENAGYAEDKTCTYTQTQCDIKNLADTAKEWMDYYDAATKYADLLQKLGEFYGIISKGPSELDRKFQQLYDDLKALEEGINWTATMNFIAPLHGEAAQAVRDLAQNQTVALQDKNDDAWIKQGPAVMIDPFAVGPFHRPYNSKTALTQTWFYKGDANAVDPRSYGGYTIDDLDSKPGNLVYDWRLGIPPLLEMISWRIQYFAAQDVVAKNMPFHFTGVHDVDLTAYKDALVYHYKKMLDGIKCGHRLADDKYTYRAFLVYPVSYYPYWPDAEYMCGDIYSGMYVKHFDSSPWAPTAADPALSSACLAARPHCDPYTDDIWGELRSQLMQRMPLFQMKEMINTLTFLSHRSMDLTEQVQRIQPYGSVQLCLDAPNWTSPGRVQLSKCNGESGQKWVYDRKSGRISNPVSALCLDTLFYESAVPGVVAGLWYCNGDDSQKWTWDRGSHVLQNGLGTVLDIPYGKLQAGTPVWTWPPNGSQGQQWFTWGQLDGLPD